MVLARELNKFLWEVRQLSPEEFALWLAYFKLEAEQREKEQKKAKQTSRQSRR